MGTRRFTARSAALGITLTAALLTPLGVAPALAETLVPISGSGSTWAQDAVEQWRAAVYSATGQAMSYAGVGSRGGLGEFARGTMDFAVSEHAFDSEADGEYAIASPPFDFASLPIAAGATSIAYNLRSGDTLVDDLRLSGDTVAKIFTGVITRWDDPAVQAENPQIVMPAQDITPVVRADLSGSTEVFTSWMSTQHEGVWSDYCV
ncbi:substrate-binding domain-containing protein [Glaciihabitans tibetensis]